MSQLEDVLPLESVFEDEYAKYGLHFRNLKITRKHLAMAWKNDGLEITTPASAKFQIKAGFISGWVDVTVEMLVGIRLKPLLDSGWTLHPNAEPILTITKIGKIDVPKAGDLVAAWLKSVCIQPQVSDFQDFIEQSNYVKAAMGEATKQMAAGIKIGNKWQQVNVLTYAKPYFLEDHASLIFEVSAKAIVATPTKHHPKAKRWEGLTPLSLSDLDNELPNNGQIDVTLNEQSSQADGPTFDLNLNLKLPIALKGHGKITLNKIEFD